SPQKSDLNLSGPPSGQGIRGGARTRDRAVPADLRAALLAKKLDLIIEEVGVGGPADSETTIGSAG
ncbi:hypothetical protein PoB_005031500, partial [Plakobranchus ocellatus]